MSKQKKYILQIEEEISFEVFGLSTPFADYRLAWELNDKFDFKFEKTKDITSVFDRKTKKLKTFQSYSFIDEENLTEIYLLKNKQGNQIVSLEHSMMDFFLILKEHILIDSNNLLTKLRKTNGIVAVFKLNGEKFDFIYEMS